jgi:hypothetical protein
VVELGWRRTGIGKIGMEFGLLFGLQALVACYIEIVIQDGGRFGVSRMMQQISKLVCW